MSSKLSVSFSNHCGRSANRSSEFLVSSFFLKLCYCFSVSRCHSVTSLGYWTWSCFSSGSPTVSRGPFPLPLSTSPAMSMLTTNCFQNWRITLGTPRDSKLSVFFFDLGPNDRRCMTRERIMKQLTHKINLTIKFKVRA